MVVGTELKAAAHIAKDGRVHDLLDHLTSVSDLAASFAARVGSADHAALAGLWHDVGKYSGDFQRMIHAENGIEAHIEAEGNERDHSSAGAILAADIGRKATDVAMLGVAFAIAGHHTGLADRSDLRRRLMNRAHLLRAVQDRSPPAAVLDVTIPLVPGWLTAQSESRRLRLEMWTRLLFSALCDADFLDTERFFDAQRVDLRSERQPLGELASKLRDHMDHIELTAPDTEVNRTRREVRHACIGAARSAPGMFSLTVPTGGGKTLAAMSFALEHALHHGLSRVVVAIPYTSIIEQNAGVYRSIFGSDAIVEHHSALDPIHESARNRIASENWDALIVVTTNVQLFESLFARRPSACRKLHNLAGSVIVLDEAQSLPGDLLPAILDALGHLVEHCGCSVVISTATQPAFVRTEKLPMGVTGVREICSPELGLFQRLKRVDVNWPNPIEAISYDDLALRVASEPSCLAVVHLRNDARTLCALVDHVTGDERTFHLSALMTPEHRTHVLAMIRATQSAGSPVRLVATQLVEAGVDLDFPVVFRALAGLDSLAQAAGRCNREGRIARGVLHVFEAPTKPPDGVPRTGADITRSLLRRGLTIDLFAPDVQRQYFEALYERTDLARGDEIQRQREQLNYRTVSETFKLIRDGWSEPLVIAHGDGARRVDVLRREGPSRRALRALQRYTINVPRRALAGWVRCGVVGVVAETVHVLEGPALAAYDERFGLVPDQVGTLDPGVLIIG